MLSDQSRIVHHAEHFILRQGEVKKESGCILYKYYTTISLRVLANQTISCFLRTFWQEHANIFIFAICIPIEVLEYFCNMKVSSHELNSTLENPHGAPNHGTQTILRQLNWFAVLLALPAKQIHISIQQFELM